MTEPNPQNETTTFAICMDCLDANSEGRLERRIDSLRVTGTMSPYVETACRICGSSDKPDLQSATAVVWELRKVQSQRHFASIYSGPLRLSAQPKPKKTFSQCPTCGKWGQQ
jgi:hypothetical protein